MHTVALIGGFLLFGSFCFAFGWSARYMTLPVMEDNPNAIRNG